MSQAAETSVKSVLRVGNAIGVMGYTRGLRQPSVVARLQKGPAASESILKSVEGFVTARFGAVKPVPGTAGVDSQIVHVMQWVRAILEANGHTVFEDTLIFKDDGDGPDIWTVIQPCGDFSACVASINLAMQLLCAAAETGEAKQEDLVAPLESLTEKFSKVVKRGVLQGFNTFHFLAAAHSLDIPWFRLSPRHVQLGHGASSRMLDSSFTDRTSQIGTSIAREKQLGSQVLRSAAVPVARHKLAKSADDAVLIADQLGYPVVVKPADLDGGVGVAAYLLDENAVRKAFDRARANSGLILVEKHFIGRDYRIQLVNGAVHGILEREPGGVVGDGKHTVRQLVERQNRERATATDDRRHLHPIEWDEDAEAMLAHAGLEASSVPAKGVFVRLRGAANVASGGIPRPVPVEAAHPDNIALAIRTVRTLRLDVAGVDLLIPDIKESWLSSGAIICEVNAQPQMFTTMHKPMLESLFQGTEGRIPIVLVLSPGPGETVSGALHERMRSAWPGCGLSSWEHARIGGTAISNEPLSLFQGGRALMQDPEVDAIILSTSSDAAGNSWPFDKVDLIVLAGNGEAETADTGRTMVELARSARWLQPRQVLVEGSSPACLAAARHLEDHAPCRTIDGKGAAEAAFVYLTTGSLPAASRPAKARKARSAAEAA